MTDDKKERVLRFKKGGGRYKYSVDVQNIRTGDVRTLSFGHKDYEQFKDSVPPNLGGGLYSHKDHGDASRRKNYFSRHSSGYKTKKDALSHELQKSKGIFTSKILSHTYLW